MQGWYSIEVDDEIMNALKADAEPFTDTPNSVLRRKYGLPSLEVREDAPTGIRSSARTRAHPTKRESRSNDARMNGAHRRTRVPSGALLPETEYELPILSALEERGGRGATREIVQAVGRIVEEKLRPLDREDLNGAPRWQNRVQFARLGLVRQGLLQTDSPRGVWELSVLGRERLQEAKSS